MEANYSPPIKSGEENYELGLILFATLENNCFYLGDHRNTNLLIGAYKLHSTDYYLEKKLQGQEIVLEERDIKDIEWKTIFNVYENRGSTLTEVIIYLCTY